MSALVLQPFDEWHDGRSSGPPLGLNQPRDPVAM